MTDIKIEAMTHTMYDRQTPCRHTLMSVTLPLLPIQQTTLPVSVARGEPKFSTARVSPRRSLPVNSLKNKHIPENNSSK